MILPDAPLTQLAEIQPSCYLYGCLLEAIIFPNSTSTIPPFNEKNGRLLRLLGLGRLPHGFVKHPHGNKDEPAGAGDADADEVGPGGGDLV